ncbi:tumor protein p53-inducible nuclear protein 2 isoform X1 [Electrophorus electricus]|uniref:tumor protein p53-inducible nuclear protein 2 isoform X1 n=1 Tax=Electrophorus electricus TaxID=8005 RepID=UPI0015D0441C|nr:tumor protein p53-inducible nuclear protein 2 isoform X1 [Electrophorus electricus]XP_035376157.1 tumor protein p53-inducible nuclear protein 2 isoform X1 [Electrophorus electricus]
MFQRLTDLLFGSLGSATQESAVPNSGGLEEEDEEWLLVSIPDGEPLVEVIPVPSTTSVSRSVQDANSTRVTDNLVSSNSATGQSGPGGETSVGSDSSRALPPGPPLHSAPELRPPATSMPHLPHTSHDPPPAWLPQLLSLRTHSTWHLYEWCTEQINTTTY